MAKRVWTFKTARFTVALDVEDCADAPEGMFQDEEADADVRAKIESGELVWFDAFVRVYLDGVELASDSLGACCYRSVDEFVSGHRDRDPMNRNSSIMRAAKGSNAVVCHYFPSMVCEVIAEARKMLNDAPRMRAA